MFTWLRRLLFLITTLVLIGGVILLLNITDPNPTARRYSSGIPLMVGSNLSGEIGSSAEKILAADLHLPRNEEPDMRQCICQKGSNTTGRCNVCLVTLSKIEGKEFRIPDFVGTNFIAESKNTRTLYYNDKAIRSQLQDYVKAALSLKVPLWVYTRINTDVSPEYEDMVAATGGGIMPYFQYRGYIDETDLLGRKLVAGAILALLLLLLLETAIYRLNRVQIKAPVRRQTLMPPALDAEDDVMREIRLKRELRQRKHRLQSDSDFDKP